MSTTRRLRIALTIAGAFLAPGIAAAQDAGPLPSDPAEALSLVEGWLAAGRTWLVVQGPAWTLRLALFGVILLLSRVIARWAGRLVERALASSKANPSQLFQDMAVSVSRKAVFFLGMLVALGQLGVDLTPILAGIGFSGFIVGFAIKDTLSNFAAGLMILIYHPFDENDFVEAAGVTGKVENLSIVSTTILTSDNQRLIVPNSSIWGGVIRNVTAMSTRRVDMTFGIGYEDDTEQAMRILEEIVTSHELVLDEPAPLVRLHELADSSVNFIVRPWVASGDYWTVYWDILQAVKRRFDADGISIPYPQQDVHLYPVDKAS